MSDGAIALVPVGAVLVAPIVAVAGVGAVVYYGVKAAADAVRAARLAHARSRVAAECRRRDELRTQATGLRYPVPGTPGTDPADTAELNLLADQLSRENDRLAGELAAEQLKLNRLQAKLKTLEGRRETLAGWVRDSGIAVDAGDNRPSDRRWTAVQEAEHHITAVTRGIATMETGLRTARRERERGLTKGLWAAIAMPPLAELDRDPHSSSERWRAPLRLTLERALQDAAIAEELPHVVATALESIESSDDESGARVRVAAATAALDERVKHREVVRDTLRTLDDLTKAAEANENYVVLAECDVVREEFAAKRDQLNAASLDAWARKRLLVMDRLLEDARRAFAEHRAREAREQSLELAIQTQEAMAGIMAEMDYVRVDMEIGQPRNGHLFIERSQASSGKPGHGRVIAIDGNGGLQTYTVALSESSSEGDREACKRHVAIEREQILPRLCRQITNGETDRLEVIHDHSAEIDFHVLTSAQREEIARQLDRTKIDYDELERPIS